MVDPFAPCAASLRFAFGSYFLALAAGSLWHSSLDSPAEASFGGWP